MREDSSSESREALADFDAIQQRCAALRAVLGRVIVGQHEAIEGLLTALLCQGHVLLIGVPGLAKTMLVRTLARAVGLKFKRIQFTPDLMPADIMGTELIQEDPETGQRHLRFVPGPVFAQLILADEINRTPPKTQSALLEAMAERQVTVAGRGYELESPFVVVATQNPIEQEGTYPLPEAQLDRFMFSMWMDYPSLAEERRVVAETPRIHAADIEPAFDRDALLRGASLVWRMPVSDHVVDYAVALVRATRPGEAAAELELVRKYVSWGAGPRAGQALIHAAKAQAAMQGMATPSTAHVRAVAMSVLRHRVLVNYAAAGEGVDASQVIEHLLANVEEPKY